MEDLEEGEHQGVDPVVGVDQGDEVDQEVVDSRLSIGIEVIADVRSHSMGEGKKDMDSKKTSLVCGDMRTSCVISEPANASCVCTVLEYCHTHDSLWSRCE